MIREGSLCSNFQLWALLELSNLAPGLLSGIAWFFLVVFSCFFAEFLGLCSLLQFGMMIVTVPFNHVFNTRGLVLTGHPVPVTLTGH